MPDIHLVDLEVIRRYSLAIRQESADVAELTRILESDLAHLKKAAAPKRAARRARRTTTTRTPAKRTTAKSASKRAR